MSDEMDAPPVDEAPPAERDASGDEPGDEAGDDDSAAARARREARALRERLRFAEADAADAAARAEAAEALAAEEVAVRERSALMADITAEVARLGVLYKPDDLLLLVDPAELTGEDGSVDAARVSAAVDRVIEDRPHWSGHRVLQLQEERDRLLDLLPQARGPLVPRPTADPIGEMMSGGTRP